MARSSGPRLSLIAAVAANGVIGNGNALPWRLPEDMKHFKALTLGHPVIMGRKTYESIGRPLPERRNIVVSRSPGFSVPGCEVVASLEAAVDSCADAVGEIFVIGGAQLYAAALPCAQRLYLTEIRAEFPGDTHFPSYDRSNWRAISRQARCGENGLAFDFAVYDRSAPSPP